MGIPYEGNGYAALPFLTWITSAEIVLLLFSLVVLGIAFLMFVRLFDALSPPTKALTWVVGGNFALALLIAAFACMQIHYYARKEFIPQGGAFCHYVNPVVLSLIVFGWLGQPVIAWTTLKTLRNEPVPDQKLRHIYYACVAVSFITYIWGVVLSPGVIVNGSFCVMVPKTPDAIDARTFANFVGVATLVWSVVLYVKSYRHLKSLRMKVKKDLKRIRHPGYTAAAGIEDSKEPNDLSNTGQASPSLSRSAGPWGASGTGTDGGDRSAALADVESGQSGDGAGWWEEDSEEWDSDEDSEEDAPFTYEQLQARTQAARAAVNILLPNRTDDMAEREGPYGMHRRFRGQGQRLLEEGVDLSALMEFKSQPPAQQPPRPAAARGEQESAAAAASSPARWWQLWRRWGRAKKADPDGEVVQLYTKAMRALAGRACTLMVVYYLPSYVLFACLGHYKDFRPPPDILPIFGLIFFLGTPVLQTFALLHLAVTIGSNILQFYWQYCGAGGPDGDGARAAADKALGGEADADAYALELTPGTSGEESDGGPVVVRGAGFLYEQGRDEEPSLELGTAGVGSGSGSGGPAGRWGAVGAATAYPLHEGGGSGHPSSSAAGSALPTPRPTHARASAPGPLGVPQPSAFRRYAGRRQKAAPPRPASRQGHMQALSTIYEVAFKNRGRDAAAAFRHGIGASTAAGAAATAAAAEKGEQAGGVGERKSTASDGSSGDDGDATTSPGSSMAATLQRNSLVQEMLGVKVRGSSASHSSADGSSSSNQSYAEDSAASSLSGDLSSGRSGSAEGESKGWAAVTGSFFPWRSLVRSRSMSIADESEISSLTDAQDYQIGSLGTSPSLTPWGQKALTPVRPARRGPNKADPSSGSLEDGGTSLDNPSSSSDSNSGRGYSSMDSWGEGAGHCAGNAAAAAVVVGEVYGASAASVAGQTHVSGSSGASVASSNSSLVSDGGRSIVTESDWRDWVQQTKKDGPQPQQPQQVQPLAGQRAHTTLPN